MNNNYTLHSLFSISSRQISHVVRSVFSPSRHPLRASPSRLELFRPTEEKKNTETMIAIGTLQKCHTYNR